MLTAPKQGSSRAWAALGHEPHLYITVFTATVFSVGWCQVSAQMAFAILTVKFKLGLGDGKEQTVRRP